MAKAARPKPLQGEPLIIQMGPQHPSTHGVLRVELETDGEIVSKATPHIGYLHRCKEKIGEKIPYEQYVPYSDRMDYLAAINTNWTWAMAVEKLAGIEVAPEVTFLMVESHEVGVVDPFSGEKLSPVLTVWKYGEFEEAIRLVRDITRFSGYGHSCGIHTTNDEHMLKLATRARVSRVMVRQTQPYGNSGNYDNGMPFGLTLGCGTWGGNITNENIHWKHFLNITWVSKPITPVVPDENKIFGEHWKKYGK